ncbi:hypothetical protein C7M16_01636 [Bacillus subtilis]|nr:hypothetical protein C7M16_01636 [Bacillus subtilis]QHM84413.1 hypothetical protein DXY22_02485 [Bacillus subtilis]
MIQLVVHFKKTYADDGDWIKLSVNRKGWEISELLGFTLC